MRDLSTSIRIRAGVAGLSDIKALAEHFAKAGVNTDELSDALQNLQDNWSELSTVEQSEQLASLSEEVESLQQLASDRIALGLDIAPNIQEEIEALTRAYERLRESGTLTEEELARATQNHERSVQELEDALQDAAPSIQDITSAFGEMVSAASGLSYVAKEAMQFEEAMAQVNKVVDGTPAQMSALADKVQTLAVSLGKTTDEIANIAAMGGQLGVPLEELEAFTEMAGRMSAAFNITAEEAADAAAKLSNVFALPIKEIENLGDAINNLGNNTAAKEDEIVNTLLRIGGTASAFGLAAEEAAALSAAFISMGKSPEVAGTAINALLTKLQTANVQSKDFQDTLEAIGLSGVKLAKDISDNPQKALSEFLDTLSSLEEQKRSAVTFKLFGQEYVDDINALVLGLDNYKQALDLTKDSTQYAGAMQQEFENKMATTTAEVDKAKTAISVLAQNVGRELLPVIALAAKATTGLINGINDFSEAHPILTKIAVLVASAQVAMVGLKATMTLAGAVGIRTGTQISTAFLGGAGSVNLATLAVEKFNVATTKAALTANNLGQARMGRTLTGDLKGLTSQMMTLNGLFVAAAGWTIGTGIGDALYQNSSAVRAFGDELGRVVAYLDAMVTERTFDDVRANFETSAESAKRLSALQKEQAHNTNEATEAILAQQQALEQKQANEEQLVKLYSDIEQATAGTTLKMAALKELGQENSQEYLKLSEELQGLKARLQGVTEAQGAQADASKKQKLAQEALIFAIQKARIELDEQKTALEAMELAGQRGSEGYQALSEKVEKTAKELALLMTEAEKANIGDRLKTDAEKASASFKALNLDIEAFNTGISQENSERLTTFVEVAHLAEGDIDKLARAYSAAKDAIGDNVAAQNLLEEKLLQVSEGEAELAQNIKKRATEQQNATTKSDAQTAAIARLGIEMELINQKMSKGGKQLADDFRKAIPEMKKAAKSADDFKRALAEAFDTNIANARTQEDFKAIQKSLEDTGAKTSLTNEHLQRLSAGVQGGAEAVKKVMKEQADAAKAAEASTKTLTKAKENETTQTATNTAAQENNIRAKKQAAEANKQLAQSAQSAENAQEKQNASTQKNSGLLRGLAGMIDNGVNALKNMANTTEEAGGAWKAYWQHFRSGEGTGMMPLISGLRNTNERLKEQIGQFNRIKEAAKQAGTALGKTTATTEDLARAQAVLKQATGASIFGLIRMDNQTLDNLKAQIDSAKARLDDLAQSAKNTADSLEGELARLNGDDARAVEIENSKKLADLQEKLAEARKRNNSEEIAQLERALQLQRRINETKLAKTKSQNATGNETRQRASGNDFDSHIDPSAVADAWEGRIKQAEKEAVNRFATQLTSEAKRRAI